jgi:hypothetical protein
MANAFEDDAVDAAAGAATLKLYSGTQPATGNTALSGNTLLATFTFDNPAFGTASAGLITLLGVPHTVQGVAAGTATFARCENGTPANVFDCDVGTASTTLILNTTTISVGVDVSITAGTITMPSGV